MNPVLYDPDFTPLTLLIMTLVNPVVIVVAYVMGRRCDQWQKLVIAGLAAALAGTAALWIVTFVGVLSPRPFGSDSGVFVFSLIYGTAIAAVGYVTGNAKRSSQ